MVGATAPLLRQPIGDDFIGHRWICLIVVEEDGVGLGEIEDSIIPAEGAEAGDENAGVQQGLVVGEIGLIAIGHNCVNRRGGEEGGEASRTNATNSDPVGGFPGTACEGTSGDEVLDRLLHRGFVVGGVVEVHRVMRVGGLVRIKNHDGEAVGDEQFGEASGGVVGVEVGGLSLGMGEDDEGVPVVFVGIKNRGIELAAFSGAVEGDLG